MLEKKARSLQSAERDDVIAAILADMAEYGITIEDLRAAREPDPNWRTQPPPRARKQAAPKYRDPETGLTWSGQGRPPAWITAAEASGRSRETFLLPVTELFGIDIADRPKPVPAVDMSALSQALRQIEDKP